MKTSLDCIPCLIRQSIGVAQKLTNDTVSQERIVRDILHLASEMDLMQSPPEISQKIQRRLKELTGISDIYEEEKKLQNELAMRFFPDFQARIASASDPLITAARFAIAGNVVDLGANHALALVDLRKSFERAMTETFFGERDAFRSSVEKARHILYLADNAGEIAFDRLLIEQMSPSKVTLAVRGVPVLNDATVADAKAVGLDEMVKIIDNGSDAPGTLLDECNSEFLRHYEEADLVVAKGQGNFESLSDEGPNVFFLLKVKCDVIATHAGRSVGSHLLISNNERSHHSVRAAGFNPSGRIARMSTTAA